MKRLARFVVGAVVAALALTACSDGQVQRADDDAEQGYISGTGRVTIVPAGDREPAPEFNAPLLNDDGEYRLAESKGNVVVLNVWGSWCPPCRKEARGLQAVYEEFQDQGVEFIGVNVRDTKTGARNYEDEFGVTYPSVFDPKSKALLAFRDTLPPAAIPSTLVIDTEGRMAAQVLGGISEESLRDMVSDVLGGSVGNPDDTRNEDTAAS